MPDLRFTPRIYLYELDKNKDKVDNFSQDGLNKNIKLSENEEILARKACSDDHKWQPLSILVGNDLRGAQLVTAYKSLCKNGYYKSHELHPGGRCGNIVVLEPLPKIFKYFNMNDNDPRGSRSAKHCYHQYRIKRSCERMGFTAKIEKYVPDVASYVDVSVRIKDKSNNIILLGIEVALSPRHESVNISKDLEAGYHYIIVAAESENVSAIKKIIVALSQEDKRKVFCCKLQDIEEYLTDMFADKGVDKQ